MNFQRLIDLVQQNGDVSILVVAIIQLLAKTIGFPLLIVFLIFRLVALSIWWLESGPETNKVEGWAYGITLLGMIVAMLSAVTVSADASTTLLDINNTRIAAWAAISSGILMLANSWQIVKE